MSDSARARSLLAAASVAIALATSVHAQAPPEAAGAELHQIPTLTLSDEQFLKGDSSGAKPAVVTATLHIAEGSGRLPVVVLVHGSGGVGANIGFWTREFNSMGVSVFVVDGFTGRGVMNVSANQASLGRLNMIIDAYRMLEVLATHPRVDPSRIALMGFSRGGQIVLFASMKRFSKAWNRSGIDFVAYVPFYPQCVTTYRDDTDVSDRPIRIFHGTPDDYNPVAPCKAYVERLRAAGRDVTLTEYPNAAHSFDNPRLSPNPVVARNSQTVRKCRIHEDDTGKLVNTATNRPFSYSDWCVERDPHVGHDAAATEAARQSIRGLLQTVFKLN